MGSRYRKAETIPIRNVILSSSRVTWVTTMSTLPPNSPPSPSTAGSSPKCLHDPPTPSARKTASLDAPGSTISLRSRAPHLGFRALRGGRERLGERLAARQQASIPLLLVSDWLVV